MASNKRRYGYKMSAVERASLKISRNAACPCGNKVDKIYTDEEGREQIIPTPVKYKNCCIGKKLFFKDEKTMLLAKQQDKIEQELKKR